MDSYSQRLLLPLDTRRPVEAAYSKHQVHNFPVPISPSVSPRQHQWCSKRPECPITHRDTERNYLTNMSAVKDHGRVPNSQRLIQSVDLYTKENLRPSTGTTGIGGQEWWSWQCKDWNQSSIFTKIQSLGKPLKVVSFERESLKMPSPKFSRSTSRKWCCNNRSTGIHCKKAEIPSFFGSTSLSTLKFDRGILIGSGRLCTSNRKGGSGKWQIREKKTFEGLYAVWSTAYQPQGSICMGQRINREDLEHAPWL